MGSRAVVVAMLTALAGSGAGVGPLRAQDSVLTLEGSVRDTADAPLPGVLVYLDSARVVAYSDSAGAFRLPGVTAGAHRLHLRKRGFTPRAFDFEVPDGLGPLRLPAVRLAAGTPPRVTLTGTVVDPAGELPIEEADVAFNGAVVATTDARGKFRVEGVAADWGSNVVEVRRIGYAPMTDEVWVQEPVTTFDVEITLHKLPVGLPPVVVIADPGQVAGRMRAFYQRRRQGFGHFLTREEIAQRNTTSTTELLRQMPGLSIRRTSSGLEIPVIPQGGRVCSPKIFVDGLPQSGSIDLNSKLNTEWLEGIEVYTRPSDVPPAYNSSGAVCGAILVWTR